MHHAAIPWRGVDCVCHQHAYGQQKSPANQYPTAMVDPYARSHHTTTLSTTLYSHYYKKHTTAEQYSIKQWATDTTEREQFNSMPRTHPVHYRIMALHNPHLASDSSTHNTAPRSQYHRSALTKLRGYPTIRLILKRARRNQRTSKHVISNTPVQFHT